MYHWDENGQLTAGASAETLSYNWDGKLRSAAKGTKTISLKYDPMGNRIFKSSTVDSVTTDRKYIVDIVGSTSSPQVGDLPVILLELEGSTIKKKYVYANSQILSQYDSDTSSWYYYLHDRLGSVRQVINTSGNVVNIYTYEPFGKLFATETAEGVSNPFKFTGQWYDSEIDEYYLRARMYNPHISRFTSRDPVAGKFEEPLTLHAYLYCLNDPINKIDPKGEFAVTRGITMNATEGTGGATVTIQSFYGISDDLEFFCGYMLTVAGGPEPTFRAGLSGSISGVIGYSPDAQSPEDFSGPAFEVGGSGGAGFNAGVNWTFGLNGVTLRTVSFGYGSGVEAHGQLSQTFVFGDWTLGPSSTSRTRSPFEQYLTNLFGEWGTWGLYP